MKNHPSQTIYRIRVESHIEDSWSDWFDGVNIEHDPDGHSILTVSLPDQAALVALLQRLHHLAITITDISIQGDTENLE